MKHLLVHGFVMAGVLAVIAASTPTPASDDGDTYRDVGRQVLIPNCPTIHCFRVLVPAVLEHLPGPSRPKWKAYAVITVTVGAMALGRFCLLLGIGLPGAIAAAWISALGAGSLYALYDSYTSDPLMYMIGPVIAVAVAERRIGRAALAAGVGVFAKEFAAAPLWIFAADAALERRRDHARRLSVAAGIVTLVWLAIQLSLRLLLHYRHSETASANVFHGAYLAMWFGSVGRMGIVYLFVTFGALYLLFAAGLVRDHRSRMLTLAALPAIAAFVYVQQPERALWNFHFIVIPIAVQVLEALPGWVMAVFVVSFGVVNLRFGAQLPFRLAAQAGLALSILLAGAAIVMSRRTRDRV